MKRKKAKTKKGNGKGYPTQVGGCDFRRTKPPKANTLGRPTRYDPHFCDIVIREMGRGKCRTEIARLLNISRATIIRWERKYTQFALAISVGETAREAWWKSQFRKGRFSNIETGRLAFYMKNEYNWADRHTQEVNVKGGLGGKFTHTMDPAEAMRTYLEEIRGGRE